jgi:hypothetical protein
MISRQTRFPYSDLALGTFFMVVLNQVNKENHEDVGEASLEMNAGKVDSLVTLPLTSFLFDIMMDEIPLGL